MGMKYSVCATFILFMAILSSSCARTQVRSWEYGKFSSFRSDGVGTPFVYWETSNTTYTGSNVREIAKRVGFDDYQMEQPFSDISFINCLGSREWELICITDVKERNGKEYFFKLRKQ